MRQDGLGIAVETPQAKWFCALGAEELERKARPTARRKPPYDDVGNHSFFRFSGKEKEDWVVLYIVLLHLFYLK